MCDAEVEGVATNSTTLKFIPHEIKPDDYTFDVGTAGSMILVFQACLLSALKTTAPLTVRLKGGTDVRWAPSWDYFTNVFLPLIQKIGINVDVALEKRGYYPTGGGEAVLTIQPNEKLTSFHAGEPEDFTELFGSIYLANLPDHIGTRMKHAAIRIATKHNLRSTIKIDSALSSSPGAGITVWAPSEKTILGSTLLGEKQISAETVGETATTHLIQEIKSGATIDSYAIDQLLPYFVVAPKGSTCLIRELSNHTKTNMWLVKHFFDIDFEVTSQQNIVRLTIT